MPIDTIARNDVSLALQRLKTSANAYGLVDLGQLGLQPGDNADVALDAAAAIANPNGWFIQLPPFDLVLSRWHSVNGLIGTSGKSRLILSPTFDKTGSFNNEFCLTNTRFATNYDGAQAPDEVVFRDFDIVTTPSTKRTILGLANIRKGLIERVNIRALQSIGGDSKPVVVGALIDLYAVCKNVTVRDCILEQLTGGYGVSPVGPDGGGGMWVRNITSNGALPQNVTENIEIYNNVFRHYTTDEALAVYGVLGPTRRVNVHHNRFFGLMNVINDLTAAPDGVYHSTLISFFPLRSGLAGGANAAVTDCAFTDNYAEDRSVMYSVVRIGNAADVDNRCEKITSARNKIGLRQPTGANGVVAAWTAHGGLDPRTAGIALRNIEHNTGTGYSGTFSGNTTSDDSVFSLPGETSETISTAIGGFAAVFAPTVRGNVFTALGSCGQVTGGLIEASGRAYHNVLGVSGGRYRVTGTTGYAAVYDGADQYSLTGTRGTSAGGFVRIPGNAGSSTRVIVLSNVGSATGSGAVGISNAVATAVAIARLNDIAGVTAASSGVGVTSSLNRWGAITD